MPIREKVEKLHRRYSDDNESEKTDCMIKRLYNIATPYIQILGFIILCAFTVGSYWTKVDGYDGRINDLEAWRTNESTKIDRIDQKLDDMITYWHIPRKQ